MKQKNVWHYEGVQLGAVPQWGAADAEIKVPSAENTELKRSQFKTWNRSEYNQAFFAYCQGILPWTNFLLFGPFTFIFYKTSREFFLR